MTQAMPCLIINLDRNPERMTAMNQRFSELGLVYERFPAVDGSVMSEESFKSYTEARPRAALCGKWTKGKAGCQLSHRGIWEWLVASDHDYVMVLEDDMVISDAIVSFLMSAEWIPSDADIVRLEDTANLVMYQKRPASHVAGRTLHRLLPNKFKNVSAWGNGTYVITKAAAQRLLGMPADYFSYTDQSLYNHITSMSARSLTAYQVKPAVTAQYKYVADVEGTEFDSQIETSDEQDIYVNQNKLKYVLRKYGSKLYLFQLFSLGRRIAYTLTGCERIPYEP